MKIANLLSGGCYIETACAIVGLSRSTFYNWIKKAKESKNRNKYTIFMDTVSYAQACDEARLVGIISKHCEYSWQATAWMLEHRFTDRWGKQVY